MKKIFFVLCTLLLITAVNAQQGLQGLEVEKYYISNANDSIVSNAQGGGNLPVGSVTWRFYANLLPGYKLQAVYGVDAAPAGQVGVGDHELRLQTTTTFFNNEDTRSSPLSLIASFKALFIIVSNLFSKFSITGFFLINIFFYGIKCLTFLCY